MDVFSGRANGRPFANTYQVEHHEVLVGVHCELDLRVEVEVARLTRVVVLEHHPLHHEVLLVVVQLLAADLDEGGTLDARAALIRVTVYLSFRFIIFDSSLHLNNYK